jgi:hypothetical protein
MKPSLAKKPPTLQASASLLLRDPGQTVLRQNECKQINHDQSGGCVLRRQPRHFYLARRCFPSLFGMFIAVLEADCI